MNTIAPNAARADVYPLPHVVAAALDEEGSHALVRFEGNDQPTLFRGEGATESRQIETRWAFSERAQMAGLLAVLRAGRAAVDGRFFVGFDLPDGRWERVVAIPTWSVQPGAGGVTTVAFPATVVTPGPAEPPAPLQVFTFDDTVTVAAPTRIHTVELRAGALAARLNWANGDNTVMEVSVREPGGPVFAVSSGVGRPQELQADIVTAGVYELVVGPGNPATDYYLRVEIAPPAGVTVVDGGGFAASPGDGVDGGGF